MMVMEGLGAILEPLGPLLGASWADLGSSWAPKRAQEGAQDEPKTKPKRHYFFDRILMRFGRDMAAPKRARQLAGERGDLSECALQVAPSILLPQVAKSLTFGKKGLKTVLAKDSQHASRLLRRGRRI